MQIQILSPFPPLPALFFQPSPIHTSLSMQVPREYLRNIFAFQFLTNHLGDSGMRKRPNSTIAQGIIPASTLHVSPFILTLSQIFSSLTMFLATFL